MASKTYWLASAVWMIPGLVAGVAGGFALKPDSTSASFEQPAPAAIAERAFPGARLSWSGGGTFQVPAQAAPGEYIVAAGSSAFGCAWVRLKADDGKPKSVIDSGAINRGGFDRFTVASTDRVLKLQGDCEWARS